MSSLELTDAVLDQFDELRAMLKAKHPEFTLEVFHITENGSVSIRMDKIVYLNPRGARVDSERYLAIRKKDKWKLVQL